jgi:L-arabinose transport system ATP-binding protein
MDSASPYLEFQAITKVFPGVRALDDVSFGITPGRVHALVGENGAGKSTLLKILSGAYTPTSGSLAIAGEQRFFRSTSEALDAGVAVIYQELNLIPQMSVAENLYLGHMPGRWGMVDRRELHEQAREQLEVLGEDIHPAVKIGSLPIAQRQMVEIAKALTRGARIIAFDEPTSSLSEREVRKLFAIVADLRQQGHLILYVSHRLEEIFALCDSATVLRDGRHVETSATMAGVTRDTLINRMVGRDIVDVYGYSPRPQGEPALEVENITGPGLEEPASLMVAQGEVVGVFGLVGAGRSEMLRILFGASPARGGEVKVRGRTVRISSPKEAIRAGVMLCPEDRKKDGLIAILSVLENLNITARRHYTRMGFVINSAWEQENARAQIDRLDIRTTSMYQLAGSLSGGNQQKVILARWLSEDIKVLLLDEPTRGVDVGAKKEIYALIYDLARRGVGVLMVSSELPEVLGVTDRILVMRQGGLVASLMRSEATEEEVLRLALPETPVAGGPA